MHRIRFAYLVVPSLLLGVILLGDAFAAPATTSARQGTCADQVGALDRAVGEERQAPLTGGGQGLPIDEIITTLRACWQELQPKMALAEQDCAQFKALVGDVLAWARQVQLLGLGETFAAESAEIMPWRVRALVNCFDEAFDKCVDQKDLTYADEMRRVERELALVGADGEIDKDKYEKCLRFEVAFETVLEHVINGSGSRLLLHVRAIVSVQGRYDGSVSVAEQPLEPVALTPSRSPGCTLSENLMEPGAPFRVLSLAVDRAEPSDAMPAPPVRDFILSFERGDAHERYSYDCPRARQPSGSLDPCPPAGVGPVTVREVGAVCRVTSETMGEGSLYASFFDQLHEDERSTGGYTIRGWTMVGSGGVLARKVYERSRPGAGGLTTLSENTTLELRHTPVR